MKKILCLDLGTKTGWAARNERGHIMSGTVDFSTKRHEGGGMRYLRFSRWLADVDATLQGIDCLYFEEVRRHVGTTAAHVYGGFLSHVTSYCDGKDIPYSGVPVPNIKKFATGKGNAKKKDMILAAQSMGFDPEDDNEADALCLLKYVISEFHNG